MNKQIEEMAEVIDEFTEPLSARYSKSSNRWCSADACCYHEGITHWMPLPEPPKMKGGDTDA